MNDFSRDTDLLPPPSRRAEVAGPAPVVPVKLTGARTFVFAVVLALAWAVYTRHVWEDFYITYRASKNLAVGQGLTFTVGERVHSFTSPLGVLLPALASLLTGNTSDTAALWIFRLMGALALGGAVVVLQRTLRRMALGEIVVTLMAGLMLSDAKILDYAINGMETPFYLLFFSWTLWALYTNPERRWLHLGLAWAGLQWTRPDAFIYIGAMAVGVLIFRPTVASWRERLGWLRGFFGAGLITTALYLPWLVWAWIYYGTPVPHTITAKGLFLPKATPGQLFEWLKAFPGKIMEDHSVLAGTFMPAYSFNTGWPAPVIQGSFWLALVAIVLWLVPRVRWEARVASFTAAVAQFYLHSFVAFPIPWYLPPVAFFAFVALVLVWGQLWAATGREGNSPDGARVGRHVLSGMAGVVLLGTTGVSLAAAYQLHWQQKIVEEGERRVIGEWLRTAAASEHETVFLEPLGYIGFYSNLKMLDFPGLCSPEVVAARRRVGPDDRNYPQCWSEMILDLEPDWLVLRSYEIEAIRQREPRILDQFYRLVRVFDVRAQIAAKPFMPGRGYLTNDAYFEVYRHRPEFSKAGGYKRIGVVDLMENECWSKPAFADGLRLNAHAPSRLVFEKNIGARWLAGGFGFAEGAYAKPEAGTDGAVFTITYLGPDGGRRILLERALNPCVEPADRGVQKFRFELPAEELGRVELAISPGPQGNNSFDWTYWSELALETPH